MLPSRLFLDDFFDDFDKNKKIDKMMKCDIYEEDELYIIEMDMPGASKQDITLDIENGYLSITYKKEEKDVEKKYIHRERFSYTNCSRKFYVGDIDEAKVDASFKDGILKISLPKKEKESSKKTININ
ncbi:MAG: Hsp20 family protein [Erysipelotrichales bacterium]|nr:Hsp20 family protein [Erysipelotrichales bacterium]